MFPTFNVSDTNPEPEPAHRLQPARDRAELRERLTLGLCHRCRAPIRSRLSRMA
ncbi:MAG: hypothetical protein MZV65_27270 [Chromatiales bacterium]|nr:hypothetical protein [Chromatiales bacterium]